MDRLRARIADWFIIRATTAPIQDAQPATRHTVAGPDGDVECFVTRKRPQQSAEPWDQQAKPELLILKLPGTGGRAEKSTPFPAALFPQWDVETWTWNPPGYGKSDGRASLSTMPEAVDALWEYLKLRRIGPETKTMLIGNSLGSATALYLASHQPMDVLVIKNPPPLRELVVAGDAWWNLYRGGRWLAQSIAWQMDAFATAPRCNGYCLFLRSEFDRVVPSHLQLQVYEKYAGPKDMLLLPEAEHDTPFSEDDIQRLQFALSQALGEKHSHG